jgi:hypothetical protein
MLMPIEVRVPPREGGDDEEVGGGVRERPSSDADD